jgi:hypothetical protein
MPKPNKTYMGPSLFPTDTPSLICTHTPSLPLSPHASSLWLMESWTLHPLLLLYIFSYCPTQLRQLQQSALAGAQRDSEASSIPPPCVTTATTDSHVVANRALVCGCVPSHHLSFSICTVLGGCVCTSSLL